MPNIEYQDLEIEVSRCLCGEGEVRLLDSRLSRPRERFAPAYDVADLHRQLERLDHLILAGPDSQSERRELAQRVGRQLHAALLPGRVRSTFDACLAALHATRQGDSDRGMRIRLSFGEADRYLPEIVGLPWELICSPETGKFPARAAKTPMVRYLDLQRPVGTLAVKPPLRILAVLTSPRDMPPVNREVHRRALLQDGLRDRVEVGFPYEPSLTGLQAALEEGREAGEPFHGLHFLGHGAFDERGEGYLNFEDGRGGRDRVPADTLAELLGRFPEVRWATLASCSTARMMRRRGQHPFAGVAPALLVQGLSAVVGMQFPVSQAAAERFTAAFYSNLAEGRSMEEAVNEGRLKILVADSNSLEWASPVLFLRSRDGRVLDVEAVPEEATRDPARGESFDGQPSSVSISADQDSGDTSIIAGRDVNNPSGER